MPSALHPLRRRSSEADVVDLVPPPFSQLFKETKFKIGGHETPGPLVPPGQVKAYLRLLRAFHQLKVSVEDDTNNKLPQFAKEMDKISRWTWFVTLAVDRFERWLTIVKFAPLDKFLRKHFPPLDVWMVWHAYILNPIWYAEDSERISLLRQVKLLNMFVVGSINYGGVPDFGVRDSRVTAWRKQTGVPFDPFDSMAELNHRRIHCPKCSTRIYVPFILENGTGYAQRKFSALCPIQTCRMKITKESLAIAKFVNDLTQPGRTYMAGTLFTPYGKPNYDKATAIKNAIGDSPGFQRSQFRFSNYLISRVEWEREIKEAVGYSREALMTFLGATLRDYGIPMINRIASAYTDDKPFSIDLVEATLRQNLFIGKLEEISWLKGSTFRGVERERILRQTVVRYHSFLDLITSNPNTDFVPTLDIDTVWHCHQLMANRYHVDCELYIGRIVDHELKTPEGRLTTSLRNTCSSWQSRFRSPYMQCGCPPPHSESVLNRLGRLFSFLKHGYNAHQAALHPAHAPATHPSLHNVVLDTKRDKMGSVGGVVEAVHSPTSRGRRASRSGSGDVTRPATAQGMLDQGQDGEATRPGTAMGIRIQLPTTLMGLTTMSLFQCNRRNRDGRAEGEHEEQFNAQHSPKEEKEPGCKQESSREPDPEPVPDIPEAEVYSPISDEPYSSLPDSKYSDQGYGWNTWAVPDLKVEQALSPIPIPSKQKAKVHSPDSYIPDPDSKRPPHDEGYGWSSWTGDTFSTRLSSSMPKQMNEPEQMQQVHPPSSYYPFSVGRHLDQGYGWDTSAGDSKNALPPSPTTKEMTEKTPMYSPVSYAPPDPDSKRPLPDQGYGWSAWASDDDDDDDDDDIRLPPPLPPKSKEMAQRSPTTKVMRMTQVHPLGPRNSAVMRERPRIPASWAQYQHQSQDLGNYQHQYRNHDWSPGPEMTSSVNGRFSHNV